MRTDDKYLHGFKEFPRFGVILTAAAVILWFSLGMTEFRYVFV
jgi:hypothetical protein